MRFVTSNKYPSLFSVTGNDIILSGIQATVGFQLQYRQSTLRSMSANANEVKQKHEQHEQHAHDRAISLVVQRNEILRSQITTRFAISDTFQYAAFYFTIYVQLILVTFDPREIKPNT